MRYVLQSRWFQNPGNWYARYSWPVEFVVRAVKEVGCDGFSVDSCAAPLTHMGQTLFEPPDVNGWELGQGWFSTGAMLARMNFASTIAANQRFNLAAAAAGAQGVARDAGRVLPRSAVAGAVRRRRRSTSCTATCAPAAPGPAPTRSCRPRPPGWRG